MNYDIVKLARELRSEFSRLMRTGAVSSEDVAYGVLGKKYNLPSETVATYIKKPLEEEERADSMRRFGAFQTFVHRVSRNPQQADIIREHGDYWRTVRKRRSMLRAEVAPNLSVGPIEYELFEQGLRPLEDLPNEFLDELALALDAQKELEEFRKRYKLQ